MNPAYNLKITRETDADPTQFTIENDWKHVENFDKEYVNFSGYFGQINPNTIAAAPALLDALYQYRSDLIHPVAADSRERRLAMIDALIAKATKP